MPDVLQSESRDKSSFPIAFTLGAVIVLLIVGGLVLASRLSTGKGAASAEHLPFGAKEQAAAERIHFLDPQMGRASNFLNQDVTYIAGVISNDGVATVKEIEVNFEFHDPFNQVILRETRRLLGPNARPLAGGERRNFQISLEYVPSEWNQQYPVIHITGLLLR
ncbi:MAG: hypothetical protein WAK91_17175 [Candidatus Acidiferrales bacterium]